MGGVRFADPRRDKHLFYVSVSARNPLSNRLWTKTMFELRLDLTNLDLKSGETTR